MLFPIRRLRDSDIHIIFLNIEIQQLWKFAERMRSVRVGLTKTVIFEEGGMHLDKFQAFGCFATVTGGRFSDSGTGRNYWVPPTR